MPDLTGKIALVTGASKGMGETHARTLVAHGAKVVMTDISAEGAEIAEQLGPDAHFLVHDVTDPSSWSDVVAAAGERFGVISTLVNNAGVSGEQAGTLDVSDADYQTTVKVDQYGVFLGMRAVLPGMIEQGAGSIINISSISGIRPAFGTPNIGYIAAKAAVAGMTKFAALEYAAQNIRVNSVHPGAVRTPFAESLLSQAPPEFKELLLSKIPSGRFAETTEVSNLVAFLASDESAYITGAELVIDGGALAQ